MTKNQKIALGMLFAAHACTDPIARVVLIRDAEAHLLMLAELQGLPLDNHDSEQVHSAESAAG